MHGSELLLNAFRSRLGFEPTPGQDKLFSSLAEFICSDQGDILVVNGYAGTGKTSAMAAVVSVLADYRKDCVLLAPTGRAAKVLSSYTGRPAYTVHKHIYRQKTVSEDGVGLFSLSPNKAKGALFIVDEVSLIGFDSPDSMASFGSGNLLEDLIRFVRSGVECKLVMVGDSAQLPPVGMEKSPALSPEYMSFASGVSFVSLSDVVRQQQDSGILRNATAIRRFIEEDTPAISPGRLALRTREYADVERIGGGELIDCLSDAYDRWGEDGTVVLCRSNKRANRYNAGIRAQVLYREEELVRGERVMIVRNCYHFLEEVEGMDYIANGDMAVLMRISRHEERYGLHFAEARLRFPDYGDLEIVAKVCLDTLLSESPSLSREQQNRLFQGVLEDYSYIATKKKRYAAVREDPYYNALQLKYAEAITCHKSQGGQWGCVFIDNPFWQDELVADDLKWLYTAITRGVEKVYLVNFKDECFDEGA